MIDHRRSRKTAANTVIAIFSVVLLVWFGMCMIRPYIGREGETICAPGLWKHGSCALEDADARVAICREKVVGVSADRFGEIRMERSGQSVRLISEGSEIVLRVGSVDEESYLLAVNFDGRMAVVHSAGRDFAQGGAQPRLKDVRVLFSNGVFAPALSPQLSQFSHWLILAVRPINDQGFICLLISSVTVPTKLIRLFGDSAELLPVENAIDLSGDGRRALLEDDWYQTGMFRIVDVESGKEVWRFSRAQLPARLRMSLALDSSGDRCFVFEPNEKRGTPRVTIVHRDGRSVTEVSRGSADSTSAWFGAWIERAQGGTINSRVIYSLTDSSHSQRDLSNPPRSKN